MASSKPRHADGIQPFLPKLNSTGKAVLLWLWTYGDIREESEVFPSISRIALELGYEKRCVQYAIAQCKAVGALDRVGGARSTRMTLKRISTEQLPSAPNSTTEQPGSAPNSTTEQLPSAPDDTRVVHSHALGGAPSCTRGVHSHALGSAQSCTLRITKEPVEEPIEEPIANLAETPINTSAGSLRELGGSAPDASSEIVSEPPPRKRKYRSLEERISVGLAQREAKEKEARRRLSERFPGMRLYGSSTLPPWQMSPAVRDAVAPRLYGHLAQYLRPRLPHLPKSAESAELCEEMRLAWKAVYARKTDKEYKGRASAKYAKSITAAAEMLREEKVSHWAYMDWAWDNEIEFTKVEPRFFAMASLKHVGRCVDKVPPCSGQEVARLDSLVELGGLRQRAKITLRQERPPDEAAAISIVDKILPTELFDRLITRVNTDIETARNRDIYGLRNGVWIWKS